MTSRPIMALHPRSRTGIPGVGFAQVAIRHRVVPHFVANCGQHSKKFNIVQLGRTEAFRRALKVRAAYETAGKGAA